MASNRKLMVKFRNSKELDYFRMAVDIVNHLRQTNKMPPIEENELAVTAILQESKKLVDYYHQETNKTLDDTNNQKQQEEETKNES